MWKTIENALRFGSILVEKIWPGADERHKIAVIKARNRFKDFLSSSKSTQRVIESEKDKEKLKPQP